MERGSTASLYINVKTILNGTWHVLGHHYKTMSTVVKLARREASKEVKCLKNKINEVTGFVLILYK